MSGPTRRLVFLGAILALITPARGDDGPAIDRALGYLSREVPAWSRLNKCFSCHNNGDAARALYGGIKLGRVVAPAATNATDAWLADPARWDHNGGDGPFSDKILARIAFTAGLASALAAERIEGGQAALIAAGRRMVADQNPDGSWRVDAAETVGSPATYGRPLATWLAFATLQTADPVEFAPALDRARGWLACVEPINAPTGAVVLLANVGGPERTAAAFRWFEQAQGPDGGWGPYATAPPEVFDTALGVLALARHTDRPGTRDLIRQGRAFLIASQNPDGSWTETTRPSGNESYAQRLSTTGWATLALFAAEPAQAAQNLHPPFGHGDPAIAAEPIHPFLSHQEIIMADPRNIAHDKKVQQEKKHNDEQIGPDNAAVAPQPGKKTPTVKETPTEEPVSSHATSQHHRDEHTGHVEEPTEVQAQADAAAAATEKQD